MRKVSWAFVVLAVVLFTPPLFADTYQITLYDGSNPAQIDGTGSFTYTGTTFSSFILTWGIPFDLTNAANMNTPGTIICALSCLGSAGSPSAVFAALTAPTALTWFGLETALIPQTTIALTSSPSTLIVGLRTDFGGGPCNSQSCAPNNTFGQGGTFTVTNSPVPEPGVLPMVLLGLVILISFGRLQVLLGF